MERYQFTRSITVERVPYAAGDVVDRSEILPGCFESLTRTGALVPCGETVSDPADPSPANKAPDTPDADGIQQPPPAPKKTRRN